MSVWGLPAHHRDQLIKCLRPSVSETHSGVFFAGFFGPVNGAGSVASFAVWLCFKGYDASEERIRVWLPTGEVGVCKDEFLIGHDFEIPPFVWDAFSVWATDGHFTPAAGTHIELDIAHKPGPRAKPFGIQGGGGPAPVESFAGNIGFTHEN